MTARPVPVGAPRAQGSSRSYWPLVLLFLTGLLWLTGPAQAQTPQKFKVGSFTKINTVATQNVAHGLGDTPKALILWTNGKTNENFSASFFFAFGFTDQSMASYSVAGSSQDGVTTPSTSRRMAANAITIIQWDQTLIAEADVSAWDSTNFTLNWTTNTDATGYIVHFLAISGSDVSSKAINWTMGTVTGNKAVTGVGFQPGVVIHAHVGNAFVNPVPRTGNTFHLGLGVMDAAGNQWATDVFSVNGSVPSNSDTQRGQQTDGCIYAFGTSLNVQKKAAFYSMDSDGFTVNFTNATSGSAGQVVSLALKGLTVKAGNFTKSTGGAPASQGVTGVGFRPQALLLASFQNTTQANPVAETRFGLGASDGTTQGSSALTDQDNVATTNVDGIDKTSKVFMKVDNNTTTINAEANLSTLDSDGFTLSWTTNDAVATQMLYLAFGDCRFQYYRSITVGANQVSGGPHTDFPMLVSISGQNYLKTTVNGGRITNANGYDIVFRAADDTTCNVAGGGTHPCTLSHEVEKYDGSAGTLAAWVRVPKINNNTVIYMYYSNSCICSATEDPSAVWDSHYKGVWHLKESGNGTAGEYKDSTSNANSGQGGAGTPSLAPTMTTSGKIANGQSFGTAGMKIKVPGLLGNPASQTLQAWGSLTTRGTTGSELASMGDYAGLRYDDTTDKTKGFYYDGSVYNPTSTSINYVGTGWHHVVFTNDSVNHAQVVYVDGQVKASTTNSGSTAFTGQGTDTWFGVHGNGGTADNFKGTLDEVRISDTARSAGWIATEYNNQSAPATFYAVQATEQSSYPTVVNLISFTATSHAAGVQLKWQAGYEAGNLGFNLYRETGSGMQPITPVLVAGSALFVGRHTVLAAGRSYVWWDRDPAAGPGARYYLEDIDLSGTKTRHGPVSAVPARWEAQSEERSLLLSEVGRGPSSERDPPASRGLLAMAVFSAAVTDQQRQTQFSLAAQNSIKIVVKEAGWYRVSGAQLLAAGMSPSVDPRKLQLYLDGVEQAITVTGESDGRLDPGDTVGFYGLGNDTTWTDTHTYWLVAGQVSGKRITQVAPVTTTTIPTGFQYVIEHKPRTVYVAALLNGDADNYFGPAVVTTPTDDVFAVQHLDSASSAGGQLSVTLQGITEVTHRVRVTFNGNDLGVLAFDGSNEGTLTVAVAQSMLVEGNNTVRLTGLGDDTDVSVVDTIRLSYQHTFTADSDEQWLTLAAGQSATLGGFSTGAIHVLDATDPANVHEMTVQPAPVGGTFSVGIGLPAGVSQATLYAFAETKVLSPVSIFANTPSSWNTESTGADVILVTHASFQSAAQSLKTQQEGAGLKVALVDIEDVYDEYSFGEKTPQALKDFVTGAWTSWRRSPHWLVLMGEASIDPRNYLGLGENDFVPTRVVTTAYQETVSDDWFGDVDGDGVAEVAVGRLPAETAEEAGALVGKLDAYRKQSRGSDWMKRVLLVADENDSSWDFESSSDEIERALGGGLTFETVYRGRVGTPAARASLLGDWNAGVGLVNYFGHGSVNVWHDNMLTGADAGTLTNGTKLPVAILMTCLNGYFVDLYTESLADALLKAANGGAVAVWASSGMTAPSAQTQMDYALYVQLQQRGMTLGQAAAAAKRAVDDVDVRRTWLLLGDPTLPSPVAEVGTPDTTPPTITLVTASGVTRNTAVITWTTDKAADSQVEYGTSASYGSSTVLDATQVKGHSQSLTGLTGGAGYHFRVRSRDGGGNLAISGDYTFTTQAAADTTPPVISGIDLIANTGTSVTVIWVTDEPADGQVVYGETTGYGFVSGVDTNFVTVHAVVLAGLSPESGYHFRVRSRDHSGNLAISSDCSFVTVPVKDTTPPVISALFLSRVTSTTAMVIWETNEPADSQVEYGVTTTYGSVTQLDADLEQAHGQALTGLSPNTLYHFRVRSRDAAGNLGVSADFTLTTLTAAGFRSAVSLYIPASYRTTAGLSASQPQDAWRTGVAMVNAWGGAAVLSFTVFDKGGKVVSGAGITNPVVWVLGGGAQLSAVDARMFGSVVSDQDQKGWIQVESSSAGVVSTISMFNDSLRALDVINVTGTAQNATVLPEIGVQGFTRVSVANPGAVPVSYRVDLVSGNGKTRASEQRTAAARSTSQFDAGFDLFPGVTPADTDYVQVTSSAGVLALEWLGGASDIAGLGGQDGGAGGLTLYSPQYLVGGVYHTRLSIVNLDGSAGTVTLRLMADNGMQQGDSRSVAIAARGKVVIDDEGFFGQVPEGSVWQGYVVIQGSGIRLTGSVVFEDPGHQTFYCALPLTAKLQSRLLFSPVASDATYFTGLAMVNPGAVDTVATIDFYTAGGKREATATQKIAGGHRMVGLLSEIFPGIASGTSGYIRVTASSPVAAFGLIGTNDLSVLAALPPQEIPK